MGSLSGFVRAWVALAVVALAAAGCSDARSPSTSHSPVVVTPPSPEMVTANTQFAFRFFQAADTDRTGNVVVSPLSLSLVLEMLANGADTKNGTQAALLKALDFPRDVGVDDVNRDARETIAQLTERDAGVSFELANGIWTAPGFTPSANLAAAVKHDFRGELARLDPDAGRAADQINSWVKRNSRGRIEKIIEPSEVYPQAAQRAMFLGNALAFTGSWTHAFDESETKPMQFDTGAGKHDVEMMHRQAEFSVLVARPSAATDGFTAVKLPYGKTERWSMYVFVPVRRDGLDAMTGTFTAANWAKWRTRFASVDDAQVYLPRLNTRYQRDLLADFGRLSVPRGTYDALVTRSTNPIVLDFARQQTYLEMDETGTKAAAATIVGGSVTSAMAPTEVRADHPYLMILADSKSGAIAFIAAIRDPNQHSAGM